ncbi:30S ribosomal protein S13 [Candidatus Uhrbacteria bacterium RIFCSPHIGHO2_12_FULL_57_11]|uniref:Small ribosomal subunit protein uS13 n=2 Tax=Candidatus Uhriibacteriota TaxID=1752732 RepID=A0A1F7UL21_9BACT|nr:MAG: 30S ribosomal protein S13 [Candidatus Uhrbacteria bacterium RIFCSPHIGHO2_02_FULL_57_19]OGL78969.1 MAG: 30S ribosomal protein S13 [Candidatus Uhrbacteria bacterium RIFCSPHIGHO2_12_FULL_57_11]
MARIAGVTLPNKRIEVALTYIFGIGQSLTSKILAEVGIDRNVRTNDLSEDQVNRLRETIEKNYRVEGELRREVSSNIKRLRDIGSWRGTRHAKRLPIHGRSKTNSRTVRGNVRRTMGSGRKTPAQKT